MKRVQAYIQPHKLDALNLALHKLPGLSGISISEVQGWGRGGSHKDAVSHEEPSELKRHAKVDIFCLDRILDDVIATIEKAAHTGLRGDGKIYVIPVEEAVRISTGERGDNAV